jgi:hypothetical protein
MTLAYHHVMKIRDNMSAVIEGLQKDHGLLAAYLEATDKIDWRALHKRVMIGEAPNPADVEAHQRPLHRNCLRWFPQHCGSSFGVPTCCDLPEKFLAAMAPAIEQGLFVWPRICTNRGRAFDRGALRCAPTVHRRDGAEMSHRVSSRPNRKTKTNNAT